jgi:hypothetical protein
VGGVRGRMMRCSDRAKECWACWKKIEEEEGRAAGMREFYRR